jgi:hypothetical protein
MVGGYKCRILLVGLSLGERRAKLPESGLEDVTGSL